MSNAHKQQFEKVDQDKDKKFKVLTLDFSKETGHSRKINNFKFEYQMFSNVIQKALSSVEKHTMQVKVIEENKPLNEIKRPACNMATSPIKENDAGLIIEQLQHKRFKNERRRFTNEDAFKSKKVLLHDVEYTTKFIDYGNFKVVQAFDFYQKTLGEMNDLKDVIKRIETAVFKVQESELLGIISGKVDEEDFDTMINLNDDVLENGRVILFCAGEILKSFNRVVENNFENFQAISTAVSRLCHESVENLLENYRDLIYAIIQKVNEEINKTQKEQCKVNVDYEYFLSKIKELHCTADNFFHLVDQLFDMMHANGF